MTFEDVRETGIGDGFVAGSLFAEKGFIFRHVPEGLIKLNYYYIDDMEKLLSKIRRSSNMAASILKHHAEYIVNEDFYFLCAAK